MLKSLSPFHLMTLLLLVACQHPLPPKEFDPRTAFEYLKTQVDFGPRVPGSPAHARMAQWLDSLLRARADTVIRQEWIHVTKQGDSLPMRNFLTRFNRTAGERLLFLAHWDTRPVADADSGARARRPIPGANDGASLAWPTR